MERSWTPVPHRGVTFSSSCRSAFFILKHEIIDILLHFLIHSMSTLFTTFLLFLDCFAQIFFLSRTYSSFFFRVSTAAVSLASSSFEDGRTFPSFLQQAHITPTANFFVCWIVIKDMQVHTKNVCDTWSLVRPLLAPLPSPREAPFPRGARRLKSFVLGSTRRSWPTRAP